MCPIIVSQCKKKYVEFYHIDIQQPGIWIKVRKFDWVSFFWSFPLHVLVLSIFEACGTLIFKMVINSLPPWKFFHAFLLSADFFQNKLFRKFLLGIRSKCQTV